MVSLSTMATMADVANHAGVGIGTVSRVLTGSSKVSDATRTKVQTSAEFLGYKRSRKVAPKHVRNDRLIAILMPFFDTQSAFQRLRGVVSHLAPHGCEVVLHNVESPVQARNKLMELPRSPLYDGLIVVSLPLSPLEGDRLRNARFPTALVDTSFPGLPSVRIDDRAGGSLATKHLIDLGHRRIAFISEPPHNAFGFVAGAHREEGFRTTMATAGLELPESFVRYGAYLHSAARQMAIELLQLPDRPTAIVAASDVQAVGCLEAANQLGIKVPEDLSVVGFDDIDLAALMSLSTVRQPLVLSGERGAQLVLEALSMRHPQPHAELLELELVVRGTTAGLKR
jgi:DNA-binding LacI/PurR family transcriptional regulator